MKVYALSFRTNIYCHIRGNIYLDMKEMKLDRVDLCNMIDHGVAGKQILLHDSTYWVLINVPNDTKGIASFWYKWGAWHYYINGISHDVDWGYVLRG